MDCGDAGGAVEGGVAPVAPVIRLTVGDGGPDGLAVVDILTLAVLEFPDLPTLIELFHFVGGGHVAVVLAVGAQNSDAYFFHERGSFLRIWMEYRQVWISSIFSSHRKLLFK